MFCKDLQIYEIKSPTKIFRITLINFQTLLLSHSYYPWSIIQFIIITGNFFSQSYYCSKLILIQFLTRQVFLTYSCQCPHIWFAAISATIQCIQVSTHTHHAIAAIITAWELFNDFNPCLFFNFK